MKSTIVLSVLTVAACWSLLGAQDSGVGTLPEGPGSGEVIQALLVEARLTAGGGITLYATRGEGGTGLALTVDGKSVRAWGRDRRELKPADLPPRFDGWTGVIVIPADYDVPDAIFLEVLNERCTIVSVPKTTFEMLLRIAARRRPPGEVLP